MFKNKTLIVVGAGASNEVNLPTGYELKNKIASMLGFEFDTFENQTKGDKVIFGAIKELAFRTGGLDVNMRLREYVDASWRIRDAMPQAISIDNFIDAHQGNIRLEQSGKLAIVQSILEAERNSQLYIDHAREWSNRKIFHAVEKSWFNFFMQLLSENCTIEEIRNRLQSVDFVIFNYDRCIEHYLYHSLQNYYGISPQEAGALIGRMNFYHPYGTVGNLPWHKSEHAIEFGASPNASQLITLAEQIRTFTEGTDPLASDVVAIRNAMRESNVVLFLGFAFHRQNLKLIRPTDDAHVRPRDTKYYATAYGLSNSDRESIHSELANLGGVDYGNIRLRSDIKCCALFHEYWRDLSLS